MYKYEQPCKLNSGASTVATSSSDNQQGSDGLKSNAISGASSAGPELAHEQAHEQGWGHWISRRRIAISLLTFSLLIGFNMLVLGVRPYPPLAPLQFASLLGTGLVVLGVAIRTWAAGTLHKSQEVTSVGPYALVRNPLYVGSFLMMFGFCILMKDWLAFAWVAGPMACLYWFQIRFEERNLAEWFSSDWAQYASRTGRCIPRSINASVFACWSPRQWMKNREYQAVIASLIGLALLGLLAAT
jgi:protein-S-isoprenylcysteine O-methyltransferase Ste14